MLQRRAKAGFLELASTKDIVPLRKDLMEGVLLKPSSAPESVIGSIFLSIGREDSFTGDTEGRVIQQKSKRLAGLSCASFPVLQVSGWFLT